jgi:DNA-binding transcriptional LysR family regulator
MTHLRDHIEKLRAFGVVVQLGSFRRAAARLRVSQPALSQTVQTLESVVGKQLLVRTSRGVTATEEGVLLRTFAEKLAVDLDALDQKLISASEPMSGLFRIGAFESLVIALFPGFIAHAYERYPNLTLSITSGTAAELPEMLHDRRVHLTVGTAMKRQKELVAEELFTEHYRLYVRAGTRALGRLPFILVAEAQDDAGNALPSFVGGRRRTIALTTFEAVKAFTLQGIGIGVLPTRTARGDERLEPITIADAPADAFGEHRIVAHIRARADARVLRLVAELKRYLTDTERMSSPRE